MPEGWAWASLSQIADLYTGNSINETEKTTKYSNVLEGYNYIATKDVGFDCSINYKNGIRIPFSETKFKIAQKESTLLCIEGGSAGRKIGFTSEDVCFVNKLCCFKSKSIKNLFIYYYLQSNPFLELFNASKGGLIGGVSLNSLKSLLIPIPPLTEQEKICNSIEEFLNNVTLLESSQDSLKLIIKQTKSKILDLAIHGKLVPQDSSDEPASVLLERLREEKEAKIKAGELKLDKNDSYIYKNTTDNCYYEKFNGKEPVCIDEEIPFDIPDNWQWCRLNELGETNIGLIYHPTDLVNTGVPVLRSNNIQNDCLCLDDLARVQTKILDNQYVADGDIFICARNGSQALVGKCTLIKDIPEKMAFGAFMAVFRSKYNDYILRYLQSFYFKDYMRESNSTQIYQLTQTMLKNALVPLPPISEQKRIVSKIEEMFERLDQIQCNLI